MKRLAFLLFAVSLANGQSAYELFGTETFHRAFLAAKDVRFDPFQELNWKAKARSALPWLNLEKPTKAQIARLHTFESAGPAYRDIDFSSPVDPLVSRVSYLVIHDSGIVPLRILGLRGTVDMFFNEAVTVIAREVITGQIVGRASVPLTSAAFAVVGKPADVTDVRADVKLQQRKQGGSTVYDLTDAGRTVSWSTTEQPVVKSALAFRLSGKRYLLVRWDSDTCNSEYQLFSVGDALVPIAGNAYDCDV